MNFGAALFLLAQLASAEGAGADATRSAGAGGAGSSTPIATASAKATARILRPVSVRIERRGTQVTIDARGDQQPQQERDEAGVLWIEFS